MPETLPAAAWTKRADLIPLVAALEPDNMRWVGGAVRDTLLGLDVADVDVATTLLPDAVIERLENSDIRAIPTGIDHGTVTAVREGGNVEITTLRRDVATDGRRATIAFASDWRDDAARRDFTFNALYAHPETRKISDYFAGLEDLSNCRVRFIGSARHRIAEDHLRILRYFRFHARFGRHIDREAATACEELAPTLKGLSRERVAKELLLLLALRDPAPAVRLMAELRVWPVILPESGKREFDRLESVIAIEGSEAIAADPLRRLAALLPPLPDLVADVAARLRLSRQQRARLICAAERVPADTSKPRALAYGVGPACAADRLILQGASPAEINNWHPPRFPLKGGAIIARGVAAGPQVATLLRQVEQRWVDENFPDKSRVDTILDTVLEKENMRDG